MATPNFHRYNLSFLISCIILLLTLFKVFPHASPLKILSSLFTTFLMIPAFFSPVKLSNNEGEQVKEKGQRGRRLGFSISLNLKFTESYYMALHFIQHFMCITIFNPIQFSVLYQ